MHVHLLDGTYELFRHHFGQPSRRSPDGDEVAATLGVVSSALSLLAGGVTHLGVATDHVIESFRNDLWPGYKDGSGVAGELKGQFPLLEEALAALGVVVWPMVELEADDALASAAAVAAADPAVEQVVICTPDKDLAQCVRAGRVVQLDRRTGTVRDEEGVRLRFGVGPESIPDWLALVGDSADGFPGLPGWGPKSAAAVLAHYVHAAAIPDDEHSWPVPLRSLRGAASLAATLRAGRGVLELFVVLATLRLDAPVMSATGELAWAGPSAGFESLCRRLGAPQMAERAEALAQRRKVSER